MMLSLESAVLQPRVGRWPLPLCCSRVISIESPLNSILVGCPFRWRRDASAGLASPKTSLELCQVLADTGYLFLAFLFLQFLVENKLNRQFQGAEAVQAFLFVQ